MADLVHVKGLSGLNAFLQQLPVKMETNVMRSALREGAKPIAEEARRRVHSISGRLAKSIRISTRSRRGTVTAKVIAGGRDSRKQVIRNASGRVKVAYDTAFYAQWVEFGTKAHRIVAKGKGALILGGRYVKSIKHPGSQPKPFLRPALDSKARQAVVAAAQYIKQRLASKNGLDTSGVEIE